VIYIYKITIISQGLFWGWEEVTRMKEIRDIQLLVVQWELIGIELFQSTPREDRLI